MGFRGAALEQSPNVEARMASSNAGASTFKGTLGAFKGSGRLLRNPLKCDLWWAVGKGGVEVIGLDFLMKNSSVPTSLGGGW